jgi:hypothetical protein
VRAVIDIFGDADLLVLAAYAGIPITDATKAIALIGG